MRSGRRRGNRAAAAVHLRQRDRHGFLDGIHTAQLTLDEAVDECPCVAVGVADVDPGFAEKLLQRRIRVVVVEALFRVPSDMLLVSAKKQEISQHERI